MQWCQYVKYFSFSKISTPKLIFFQHSKNLSEGNDIHIGCPISIAYRLDTGKKIRETIESKIRVLMKRNSSSKLSSLYFKKIAKKRKRMFRYVLGKKRHPVRSRNKWKRRRGTCEHGARFDFRWNGNARRVVIRPSNRSSRSILLAPIMDACFSSN